MGKLKLDIDPRIDISPSIEHWCKWCERNHEFQYRRDIDLYTSQICEGIVTLIQLCIEGRLIESKWKGLRR